MATDKIKFTKEVLLNIEPPKKNPQAKGSVYDTYKDEKEEGLVLLVTNSGNKTFYLYKKVQKKPEKIRIGKFPDITIDKARSTAKILKGQIEEGINPNDKNRKFKEDLTFGELFKKYIDDYAKQNTKSWKDDVADIDRNLSDWKNKKLSQITKEDVLKVFTEKSKKIKIEGSEKFSGGPYGANRLLDRINAIFNKGLEWNLLINNPARGIKKNKSKSRERFLTEAELPRFFNALESLRNQDLKDYIYVSLFTGARKGNIVSMRWKDIDLENAKWLIPVTKNDTSQIITLHDDLVGILKSRKEKIDSEFVFPSKGKSGHITSFKKGWSEFLKKAEIEDFRIHDLRRTLGSYQAISGASELIIGKSLNHKSSNATKVYAKLSNDPVKQSVFNAIELMKQKSAEGKDE